MPLCCCALHEAVRTLSTTTAERGWGQGQGRVKAEGEGKKQGRGWPGSTAAGVGAFGSCTEPRANRPTCCSQEALKGLDHKSLSQDIVKHAQYHYNPGRDVVFRGEFIPVRLASCHVSPVFQDHRLSSACVQH